MSEGIAGNGTASNRMAIDRVAVVIPARDEEALIGRCLDSVIAAAGSVTAAVTVTVVADGCLDRTADIARSYLGVRVVEIESSNVGTARARGSREALAELAEPLGAVWLANTDADSIVPENWLSAQIQLADAGCDVMIGTVRPDFAELSPEQVAAWTATHTPGTPNGHVHGANLGVRASAYLAAGGYRTLPEHEDVDLVARLAGFETVASDAGEVTTSARRFGRTPGGYARYLREEMFAVSPPVQVSEHP